MVKKGEINNIYVCRNGVDVNFYNKDSYCIVKLLDLKLNYFLSWVVCECYMFCSKFYYGFVFLFVYF